MAAASIVERLRSRTPVSVGTPVSVLILGGIVANFLQDIHFRSPVDLLALLLVLTFGHWLVTAIDRLWQMRARDASWRMFASLTISAALLGLSTYDFSLGRDDEPTHAVVFAVLMPLLAYLAVRELVWIRRRKALPA